jgi:cyclopropane fatty-acyl-phospholipid synthase-like methyltransferase
MDTDAPSRLHGTHPPDSHPVGEYYDHRLFDVMAQLWDGNLHYGLWRDENDQSTFQEAMDEMTMEMIRRLDPKPGDRVLDVGCGNGTPAMRLAQEREVAVVGITVSARQVARATERARELGLSDRVRFEQVNAMNLPYEAESFDAAWALESMLHMPDKTRVMSEIARVVRPGANIPIADMIYLDVPEREHRSQVDPAHTTAYSSLAKIEEYKVLLERAGLVVKDVWDVSTETHRTNDAFADDLESRRDELVEMIGGEGFELLIANQRQFGRTPEPGYVLITAHRP